MPRKGQTKYVMSYAQKQWDNYSPYRQLNEPSPKQLMSHKEAKELNNIEKALTDVAKMAGYETTDPIITIVSKRILGILYT